MKTKQLNIEEPLKVNYCIPNAVRDVQILTNIRKIQKRLEPTKEIKDEPIAIVNFGPSLNETWRKLKKFKTIITCSGAHKFLIEKGIIPTYHADLDPRIHKIDLLGIPNRGVKYLPASTVHPKYIDYLRDCGVDITLWHIFANDEEAIRVLPRGEWSLTGGSSIGLRLFTLARFMGYTDFHIFGMDGSFEDSTHTAEHPNAPKERFETEYNGKKYFTTPSMLFVAKETGKELDQLPDVKYTFYGEGLVQAMMKDHKHNPQHGTNIAFSHPEVISKEYIELNRKLHEDNPQYGMRGDRHKDTVIKLAESLKTHSILDYGAGKMALAKSLDFPIYNYDPAVPEIAHPPKPADLTICTDVLEHIEPDKLQFVLDDLKRVTKKVGYFVISTRKAVKTYANGQNTHLIVQGKEWWNKKLERFFDVGSIIEKKDELHVIVGPKTKKPDNPNLIKEIEHKGTKVKFYTPNDTTKWRCDTLFKKEPITIDWIESFNEGDTLLDVGANMGGYTIWAAKHKKAKVIAFEPEAETYNLLQKNIQLNEADATAYCAAVSDKTGIDKLYLSQQGIGGSCHSFGEQGNKTISQGSVGLRLDDLDLHPDHVKIDVDGFENKVIEGGQKLFANGVKSILIEVNTNLPEHMKMVDKIKSLGFEYDQEQVDKSIRKEGAFKGCAEFLFRKKSTENKKDHTIEIIKKAKIRTEPFDHIYLENVFPEDVYKKLIDSLKFVNYVPIEKARGTRGYPKRFVGEAKSATRFALDFLSSFESGKLRQAFCDKFGVVNEGLTDELLLVQDHPGYQIGPHTDTKQKVITALFYLPETAEHEGVGTSIFVPKKKGFTCEIGKHYDFKDFKNIASMPFRPNSAFIFKRTDNSFHGVTPCDVVRNVLLYDIKTK